jgi:hypothetical protein
MAYRNGLQSSTTGPASNDLRTVGNIFTWGVFPMKTGGVQPNQLGSFCDRIVFKNVRTRGATIDKWRADSQAPSWRQTL